MRKDKNNLELHQEGHTLTTYTVDPINWNQIIIQDRDQLGLVREVKPVLFLSTFRPL